MVATELAPTTSGGEDEVELVTLDDGSELWPYTSRAPSTDQQTLSINLVIYGDTQFTETILRDVPFGDWEDVDEEREDLAPAETDMREFNETTLDWGLAAGADRWVWVDPPDGDPLWLAESYQLEDGDYLGHRHHLRVYEAPNDGEWAAIQAHTEHWDWFHLRHTVHSIEESQTVVEEEFLDRWYVGELHRERFGNDQSADADGWVTIIHLDDALRQAAAGLIGIFATGAALARRTGDVTDRVWTEPGISTGLHAVAAVFALVLTYHAIRFGAIGLERHFLGGNPKLIVSMLYPLLVIGMPIMAYLTARRLDATTAFAAATLGFIIAIFIDYTYLGVLRIPLDTFVHRAALAVGIGMIAAGASATAREPDTHSGLVRTGVLVWLVAVGVPLLQFVPIPWLF